MVTVIFRHLRSPSVMGILVAERKFLGEIGLLDEGMKVYGGENVELGIRVSKPYLQPPSTHHNNHHCGFAINGIQNLFVA